MSTSARSIFTSLSISLILSLTLIHPTPAHAWWFDQSTSSAVQPQHTTGLTLSPILQAIVPSFILEPFQKTVTEQPPSQTNPQLSRLVLEPLTPTPSPTPVLAPSPTSPPVSIISSAKTTSTAMAKQMLASVNAIRAQYHLSQLSLNPQLSASAQAYATLMKGQQYFSHTSPNGQSFKDRNEQAGYTNWLWMGENIARGQSSLEQVMTDWMNSAGHKANILEPRAQELGVGYAPGTTSYWVQEFGLQF